MARFKPIENRLLNLSNAIRLSTLEINISHRNYQTKAYTYTTLFTTNTLDISLVKHKSAFSTTMRWIIQNKPTNTPELPTIWYLLQFIPFAWTLLPGDKAIFLFPHKHLKFVPIWNDPKAAPCNRGNAKKTMNNYFL